MSNPVVFEVAEDRQVVGQWRVEAFDHASGGECYVALFVGHDAERMAREYAAWRNGRRGDSPAPQTQ